MKTSFLPETWRKTLALPLPLSAPPSRSRRVLRLEQLLAGERGLRVEGGDDSGASFDASWHESSRALARGLQVREWSLAEPVHERASPR